MSQILKKNFSKFPVYTLRACVVLILSIYTSCDNKNSLPDPLEAGWDNQKVCEVIQDNDKLRVLKCTFPPGVGHERHYHKAHFGYTITGGKFRITDTTGTREVDIPDGYDFSNDFIEWHEVLNIGETTAIFLIIEPQ